jgi:hypothetical protein
MISNLLRYGGLRAWTTAGLTDKAMELLQTYRAHVSRSEFALIDIDPFLAPLKDHPGFEALVAPESKS